MLDFFLENKHLNPNAEQTLLALLRSSAGRFLAMPLDDILYPY